MQLSQRKLLLVKKRVSASSLKQHSYKLTITTSKDLLFRFRKKLSGRLKHRRGRTNGRECPLPETGSGQAICVEPDRK